jgi:plasmid maintenance system antidote protein VapI
MLFMFPINGYMRLLIVVAALRLARFFSTSADFWMNLQQSWDLYYAQLSENDDLQSIQPL